MKRSIYFDHYRLSKEYDGSPVEIGKVGAATIYKASDLRSGAPVAITLLPCNHIEAGAREEFEKQAKATLHLDHTNIVRTIEFGEEGDDFAFVSELPQAETLQAWIAENGPMPADAVLRVALQVVSALSAASFQQIVHRGIEPANIVIVAGQTAEGGWPAVKLTNFPVAGIVSRGQENIAATEFASPEQLREGTVDFRSEIYSLGATMCFLLTGAFYSAEPRSLQTKRFAKPLRKLITPMLRQNPQDRPQDPVLVTEELGNCLQQIERRQSLAQRFGIPFAAVAVPRSGRLKIRQPQSILAAAIDKPATHEEAAALAAAEAVEEPTIQEQSAVTAVPMASPTRRVWPVLVAVAALLIAAGMIAALLLPAPVSMILGRNRDPQAIGVPVGVASNTATPAPGISPAVTDERKDSAVVNVPHRAISADQPQPVTNNHVPAVNSQAAAVPAASAAPATANLAPAVLPAPVVVQKASPPSQEVDTPANEPASSANDVAVNESREPASPLTHGPQTVWEQAAGKSAHPRIAQQNESKQNSGDETSATAGNDSATQPNESATADHAEATSPSEPDNTSSARSRSSKAKLADNIATLKRRYPSLVRRGQSTDSSSSSSSSLGDRRPRHSSRHGSLRGEFAGTTPDGSLVLRFPNGQTAVIPPPPGEYIPSSQRTRRVRRVVIEPGSEVAPSRQYVSPALPSDD